ncbi:FHA domain-containing protein [Bremerella cremea]|uniref:FHA domain-containing protein n=1 Tax=Bremerella cremea TaxID=1031537 RepID=UPI0031E67D65
MLVVLEVVVGAQLGRQVKVPQDQTCKIGRTNYADEAFADDVMMSGQHFEVRNDGKYCWLRDLDSRNGTRVDHEFVKESLVLHDGQKIYAGRTEFLVRISGGAKSPYESTNLGLIEPVQNQSLLSSEYGSQAIEGSDPRFSSSGSPGVNPAASSGLPKDDAAGLPIAGSSLGDSGTDPASPPNFPTVRSDVHPNDLSNPTAKSPPWSQSPPPPIVPGQPVPGQVTPGLLPPGTPPTGPFVPPENRKRGGDDAPIFKFAKGGPGSPMGPPGGSPSPGNFPPFSPTPPSPVSPGMPPAGNFPPPPRPVPPGTPIGPPGTPPTGLPNIEERDDIPNFMNLPPQNPPFKQPPGEGKFGPIEEPKSPPWEAQLGLSSGANPNLDFGDDEFGPHQGPSLDFDDEADDDPVLGKLRESGTESPGFAPPARPGNFNPNLVGFSNDDPVAREVPGLNPDVSIPSNIEPPPRFHEPQAADGGNWRNPDYASADLPDADMPGKATDASAPAAMESVRGLCFREETTVSGYPIYQSILEGTPAVPFSPFAMIRELSRVARPVLSIHFLRAEKPIPEGLGGVPLRGDLDEKFAALGGPMLYCPEDLEPFREIVDEMWGLDAISLLFTSGDPQQIVDHFRAGLFGPSRGDQPSAAPGPQFFAVFSPNLLTTFLSQRDQETVDQLLGQPVEAILTEVADMPDSWQLFTRKSWAEPLQKLGLNRVVEQTG